MSVLRSRTPKCHRAPASRVRSAPKPPAARGYVADVRAMRSVAAAIVGTLALAGPVSARASVSTEKPWATVNVCDTKDHPDAFGVRGYMRGLGGKRRTHMYLRIQAEFQTGNGTWRTLGAA